VSNDTCQWIALRIIIILTKIWRCIEHIHNTHANIKHAAWDIVTSYVYFLVHLSALLHHWEVVSGRHSVIVLTFVQSHFDTVGDRLFTTTGLRLWNSLQIGNSTNLTARLILVHHCQYFQHTDRQIDRHVEKLSLSQGLVIITHETWMTGLPPSRRAMASSMASWKVWLEWLLMTRSITRSVAPWPSRWH